MKNILTMILLLASTSAFGATTLDEAYHECDIMMPMKVQINMNLVLDFMKTDIMSKNGMAGVMIMNNDILEKTFYDSLSMKLYEHDNTGSDICYYLEEYEEDIIYFVDEFKNKILENK